MDNQERHYNINKLNIVFALSSVTLLIAVGWMLIDDYSRAWKSYQKEFRALEIEKTRVKYDAEYNTLEGSEDYQQLVREYNKVKEGYEANCSGLDAVKKKIKRLRAENEILLQKQKFTNAKLDAARYAYETDQGHHRGTFRQSKKLFESLQQEAKELNLSVEQSNQKLTDKITVIDHCGLQLKDVEHQKNNLSKKLQILEAKLAKIDPDKMNLTNRLADLARDLPILDLANPNFKIEQIVLKDITDDVNFMRVPKVDRCITCHLGIANPDYKDAPQPFTTHPKLDQFIGRDSPHPMEEFGCTVCHGGRGRGTDFNSSAHIPSAPEQAEEWKGKYDWREPHHWDKPMLPKKYVESSCLKCHSGETVIKGAKKLNLGLTIIEKAGCYSCHAIEKYKGWPKPGPNLTKLPSKVSRDWAYRWIQDPKSFRHNTWMPAFFNQSNNSDPDSKKRTNQEIHAIVNYLFHNNQTYDKDKISLKGDAERGEELVASVGCLGCHQIKPEKSTGPITLEELRKEHGPNLIGVGTKTSDKWLYSWIRNPAKYYHKTKMPNLRLTDQEAADIVSYLSTLKNDEFNQTPIPNVEEQIINDIIFGFLAKSETQQRAKIELRSMSLDEKLNFAGKKLIRHYGCFSCHDILGFETDKPIGTELTEEGDKSVHKLDFGFIPIDHLNHAWFTQKLKEPRIFDKGRVNAPDEKLRMPNFNFTDQEVEAIVTVLLGLVKEKPKAKIVPRNTRNLSIEKGQEIVHQLNCRGCHIIEEDGGTIQSSIKDWLVKYDNRSESEAEAVVTSFSPPNLVGEGKKVQAQWLFDFLHHPTTIRPWLKVRMPTFNFDSAQLNTLLKYFSALDDQDFPFEKKVDTALSPKELKAAEMLFSDDYFACAKCHMVGDKTPGGSPDSWAPNFNLAKTRLKPEWIIQWIMNPQGLLPGTKMPNYFDVNAFDVSGPDDILEGDEHEQIRVLRNYLLTLSDDPSTGKTHKASAQMTPPVKEPSPISSPIPENE